MRRFLLAIPLLLAACHIVAPGKANGIHRLERRLEIRIGKALRGHVTLTNVEGAEVTVRVRSEGKTENSPLAPGKSFHRELGSEPALVIEVENASGAPVVVRYEVYVEAVSPDVSVVGQ